MMLTVMESVRIVVRLLGDVVAFLWLRMRPASALAAENLFLRKQLAMYRVASHFLQVTLEDGSGTPTEHAASIFDQFDTRRVAPMEVPPRPEQAFALVNGT